MQFQHTAIDPAIPYVPATAVGPAKQQSPLHMIAIAILLCCFVQMLIPDIANQIAAAADLSTLPSVLVLVTCWILSVLWHESGHLVAALLAGFDIAGVAFGPVRASRIDGRWSFQLSGQSPFAASVSAVPHRFTGLDTEAWRRGVLITVLGGPIATLIAAVTSLAVFRNASLSSLDGRFFAFAVELNALFFLLGLVPNRADAPTRNDAGVFLTVLRGGSEAHAILLYHLITQLRRQGFRPCFYPRHILRAAAAARAQPEFRVFFAQAVSEWALDRGHNDTADAWDRHAFENAQLCGVRTYNRALAQSACFDVLLRHDWRAALAKCADITLPSLTPDWFQHRTSAVALLCRRDILDAMGELQRAEFCFPSGVPYFEFQKHIVQWLRQTAKLMSGSGLPPPYSRITSSH